jgi:PAS domain S-box-containing protein
MPNGHLPVVLSCGTRGTAGQGSRRLVLGHPAPGIFTQDVEDIVTGIAAHAAIAIDNARLYESERRLASIVETSEDAIVSKDLNGTVTSWNRGRTAVRLCGRGDDWQGDHDLIPADRANEEPDPERIRRGERIDHYETVRMHKDGSLVDISECVASHGR